MGRLSSPYVNIKRAQLSLVGCVKLLNREVEFYVYYIVGQTKRSTNKIVLR